jgi:hypothetical protein
LKYRELEQLYQQFLTYGGYPAVATESDPVEKQAILKDLVNPLRAIEIKFNGSGWKERSQKLFIRAYPGVPVEMFAWQDPIPGKAFLQLQ